MKHIHSSVLMLLIGFVPRLAMDSELGPEQEEPILEALDSYN